MPTTEGATMSIGAIRYEFPAGTRSVRELAAAGLLESTPDTLESLGFEQVRVACDESSYSLALLACTRLLDEAGVDRNSIGLLVYGGAPGGLAFAPARALASAASNTVSSARFRFPSTRLQYDLGLERASVIAVDQLACTTLFGAVRVARALCVAEGIERALCVSADMYPPLAGREALYNCTADAGCAVLIERETPRNRIVAARTVTKGYYWNTDAMRDEIVASYFPTARHVIGATVRAAGWSARDVDWVIPHNVSQRSWEILMGLAGLPRARLWSRNIARDGHTLAGDNFINLRDALDAGAITPGERLLLFSYGYGAHWTALAVEA
jgi:3-oxoacyl-[acyl-carrier-protein] synthase-3